MWIEYEPVEDPDGNLVKLSRLKRPWMDEPIELTETQRANVPEDVGTRICEENPRFSPADTGGDPDPDAGDESPPESDPDEDEDA